MDIEDLVECLFKVKQRVWLPVRVICGAQANDIRELFTCLAAYRGLKRGAPGCYLPLHIHGASSTPAVHL